MISRSLLVGAVLMLAVLASGCLGSPAPAPSQNNTSSVDNVARIAASQAELDGLNKDLLDSQARVVGDEGTKDWDGMKKEFGTMYSLMTKIQSKTGEICQLQGKDCAPRLGPLEPTIACLNRTQALFEGMGDFYSGSLDLQDCAKRCPDQSETCLTRCNAVLRDLKLVCTQLRTKTPDVRQACTGPDSTSMAQGIDTVEQACRDVASRVYLRSDAQNVTEEPPLVILPSNGSESGPTVPAISGDAALDPNKGVFTTKSCSISVTPDVLLVEHETKILFRAYAGGGERITYSCGEGEPLSNGNGGLIDTFHLCRYQTEGPTLVWVALDGYVCASAPLDVDPRSRVSNPPSCRVVSNTQNSVTNQTTKIFSASVRFRYQPPSANLSWNCAGETFSKRLGDLLSGVSLSDTAMVSCRFRDYTDQDTPGRIYIDGVDCGSMASDNG